MKEYIAVSGCLLGVNVKYNGLNNYNEKVEELIKNKTVLIICPEVFGGLSIPRDPSEKREDKIVSIKGIDVTSNFIKGKDETIEFLNRYGCKDVVLKNGSPSCGKYSYDGTFTNTKIDRMGVTAKALKEEGFNLIYID